MSNRILSVASILLLTLAQGWTEPAAQIARADSNLTGPKPSAIEPPSPDAIDKSLQRGVAFLLDRQNRNGSWGSARRTKGLNIYAPVPGAHQAFRAAVTSMCISTLIETGGDSKNVKDALNRAEQWLFANLPRVRRATPSAIYNVWTHAFAIQALTRMLHSRYYEKKRWKKIVQLIRQQMEMLDRYESVDGGWGYYDFRARTKKPSSQSTSFVSATVLVAFHEANEAGLIPPEKLVQRAVASIHRQQKPDFSYLYSEGLKWWPMYSINRPGGSLGRSQSCNIALRLWGDERITDQVLKTWLDRLFARNNWLGMGRKRPIPHESWFAVAGYFFYFGHYYASRCIEQLSENEQPFYQDHLAAGLMRLQEKDGSWWDYPFYDYHQQYGTAFALMSLQRCRRNR